MEDGNDARTSSSTRTLRVFVSSTGRDLKDHRAVARIEILDLDWQPEMMEHFGAEPLATLDACYAKLARCDAMLLLVGWLRGSVPTNEQGGNGVDSFTAFELRKARELGIPVLPFLADIKWPGSLWEDEAEARQWVKGFRERLNQPAEFFEYEEPARDEDQRFPGFRAKVRGTLAKLAASLQSGGGGMASTFERLAAGLVTLPQHPWRPGISPPGALLRADVQGVPFHARDPEIHDIANWCALDAAIGIRLYTGAGGMGKTRLLIEASRRQFDQGWSAGFLDRSAANSGTEVWNAICRSPKPLLLVVDYCETRRTELIALLRAVFADKLQGGRLRIALLARAADEWWENLKTEPKGVGDLLAGPVTERIALSPLSSSTAGREESYRLAAKTFAERLGKRAPEQTPEDLEATYFDRVLLLHMTALAAVEGVKVKGDQGILSYVLGRERRFWTERAAESGLPAAIVAGIGQAMAMVTLGGGLADKKEALELLARTPLLADQDRITLNAVAKILHATYPGEKWIDPVVPDLLGEHLVQTELAQGADALLDVVFGPPSTPPDRP